MWSLLQASIEKDNWWLLVWMSSSKKAFVLKRRVFWRSNLFKESWKEHPLLNQANRISSKNPLLSSGTTEVHMFISCRVMLSLWFKVFRRFFLHPTQISVSAKMDRSEGLRSNREFQRDDQIKCQEHSQKTQK